MLITLIQTQGKVAVSWLKIVVANPNPNPTILSHETATSPRLSNYCSVGTVENTIHNFLQTYLCYLISTNTHATPVKLNRLCSLDAVRCGSRYHQVGSVAGAGRSAKGRPVLGIISAPCTTLMHNRAQPYPSRIAQSIL